MAGALSVAMRGGSKTTPRKKNSVARKATSPRTPAKRRSNPAASYNRLKNQIQKNAANAQEVGGQVAATAITQGSLALSAYAAGYFGQGKMRAKPENAFTDYRVIAGVIMGGIGLAGTMQGKGKGNGKSGGMKDNYMLALGSGLIAGPIYEASYHAGYTMAEKNGKQGERVLAGQRSGFQGTRPVMVSGASFGEADYADAASYSRLSRS